MECSFQVSKWSCLSARKVRNHLEYPKFVCSIFRSFSSVTSELRVELAAEIPAFFLVFAKNCKVDFMSQTGWPPWSNIQALLVSGYI